MGKTKNRRVLLICAVALICLLAASLTTAALLYTGVIKFNNPSLEKYPVRGVDVSHYQGIIDWEELHRQGVDFAFIKATEGSGYVDPQFSYNYENARKSGIRTGAYHFFSFDSAGATQAENFISNVIAYDGMLPPVIDIELYGRYDSPQPIDTEPIKSELRTLIAALEDEYGKTPILYTTERSYELFLQYDFEECDIWIRDIFKTPTLPDGREWTFWQYTNRGRLTGYDGEERCIDLNVFCGTSDEFRSYSK